jgi:hypothetical protein
MSFLEVVQKYGYPVVSKRIAQYVGQVQRSKGDTATKRLRLTGIKEDGSTYRNASISQKWRFLCDSGIPISDKCCDRLKKECLRQIPHPFIGAMAADSEQRGQTYYREGCNSPTADRSWPMAFWREEDVWAYIRSRNLPYSSIYDMGYKRTGCVFCMFGLGLEGRPHRFDRMAVTHPQLYRYCMDGPLQLRKVITTVYGPAMAELWNDPQPDLDFLK